MARGWNRGFLIILIIGILGVILANNPEILKMLSSHFLSNDYRFYVVGPPRIIEPTLMWGKLLLVPVRVKNLSDSVKKFRIYEATIVINGRQYTLYGSTSEGGCTFLTKNWTSFTLSPEVNLQLNLCFEIPKTLDVNSIADGKLYVVILDYIDSEEYRKIQFTADVNLSKLVIYKGV